MKIEINWCNIDEFMIGAMSCIGEDDYDSFRMLTIGFLFFEISIIDYIKEDSQHLLQVQLAERILLYGIDKRKSGSAKYYGST